MEVFQLRTPTDETEIDLSLHEACRVGSVDAVGKMISVGLLTETAFLND